MPADGGAVASCFLSHAVANQQRAARDHGARLYPASTEARHAGTLAPVSGNVHEGELVRATPRADGVVEYVLRTEEPLAFRPGQFVSVRVGVDSDDNPILRSYSIASPPGGGEISLILKLIEGGPGSSFFAALRAGRARALHRADGLLLLDLAARGRRGLRRHRRRHHAGAADARRAGGAPRARPHPPLLGQPPRPRSVLARRARGAAEERCARLSIEIFLSGEAPSWSGRRGRITQALLDDLPTLDQPVFYLVGNGAMINEVKAALQERGVDRKRQIRNEAFFE